MVLTMARLICLGTVGPVGHFAFVESDDVQFKD
jgi:hypothetical protein